MLSEPAVGKAFFGREDVLGVLKKRVNALKGGYRQNVALTGQMLSGKSSIIYQFLYTLNDPSLIPLYIEVVKESFPAFANRFIATLLYNYLRSCDHETGKELPDLIKQAEAFIPRTIHAVKKVNQDLSQRRYNDAYRKLLGLTSVLKEETQKSCVVILDEFHNLEFFKIRKPYLHFGKIIMIQKDTMYIVSSSQKNTIKKILSEKLALLFGNFEIVEIAGFDNKTATDFLKEKFQNITLAQDYADYLVDFAEGNPFYLDVIPKKIVEIANSKQLTDATEEIIIEAFVSTIYNTTGTINQYFTNSIMNLLEKNLRVNYLEILIALACEHNKLSDIAKWFKKKSTSGFAARLAELAELDIVYQNGVFYELHDKVFKFWLATVYHKKKTSLVDDVVNRSDDFKKEVKRDIDEYLQESRKDLTERLKELFSLFNGETVEIERKKRKLPQFIKIELHKYQSHSDLVTYQKPNRYWVCEICRDKIDESGVSDLIERYYPMKEKIAKKIFIALEGIDANALLLAKEKNIWVWDLNNVNNLLKVYKRHNLIYK